MLGASARECDDQRMKINGKSRPAQIAAAATLAGLLVWSIASGAFRNWDVFDYLGWWVVVPLLVLLFASLVTYLVRAWGPKRD